MIVRDGFTGATFKSVAAEAGVSVRLVQYYFGGKAELLQATRRAVMEDTGARIAARLSGQDADSGPRATTRTLLIEILPIDGRRRDDHIVLAAFHAHAVDVSGERMTQDAAASVDAPGAAASLIAAQLERAARAAPERGIRPREDAELLLAAAAGIAQGILAGQHSEDAATSLIERLLDLVFG